MQPEFEKGALEENSSGAVYTQRKGGLMSFKMKYAAGPMLDLEV